MNQPAGFFPERELLAYRRSLQSTGAGSAISPNWAGAGGPDDSLGFFPERRVLAYRRSLLMPPAPEPERTAAAQQLPFFWFGIYSCLFATLV